MENEGDHSVTADPPRRFRLTRNSLQGSKLVCNTASDVTLQQVLEEEREAWQVHSPRPVDQPYLPNSSEISPSYANVQGQQDNASTWASTTLQSLVERTSHNDSHVQVESLLASRRSFFKEGSMNEGSRGTASTWIKPTVLPNQIAMDTKMEPVVLESDGSTPRASLASRSSFGSSIDINEFKPLPEPPTTIKATVKTLAQRIKRKPPPNQDPCANVDHSSTRSRPAKKGLRKSLSTWKIFGNGESDAESIASSLQDDNKSTKSTHTMRTMRFRKKDKQPDPMDDPQISVLDERKRRAEAAYASQFGTVRKRQKQHLDSAAHQLGTVANHDTATVRRRDSATTMTTNTSHIIDRSKLATLDNVAFYPASSERHFAPSSTVSARQRQNCRSSSQDSTSTVGSSTDRRKRTSRSELEKENQQLRSMLIKEKQGQIHRSHSQVRRKTLGNDPNWQIHEDKSMHISEEPIAAPAPPPTTKCRSQRSLTHGIPPVPALPLSLANQNTLASRASDTSTVKRHRGGAQAHGIELLRSLSMVLEGSEDEANSSNGTNGKLATHRFTSTKGRLGSHENCKYEPSQAESLGRVADPEKWEWPDDVF